MLARLLAPKVDAVYTLLRVATGSMFSFHGMQKLFGVLAQSQPAAGTQLWFGGIIEFVCGMAMAVGIFTREAALLASGTMAVAYVQFHWKVALDSRFFPAMNKGELALVYSLVFLFFACRGGGPWSLDRKRAPRSTQ